MFPIPWNKEYRKKDGTLVKINDAMSGGGGGSDLPPHSASDAGKVLTVGDDGDLEWHESGGVGGDMVMFNETYLRTESGGDAVSFEKSYTVEDAGTYQIVFCGYSSPLTLKINNITESMDISSASYYTYCYMHNKQLAVGDVISFTGSATGKAYILAQVVKLDSTQ